MPNLPAHRRPPSPPANWFWGHALEYRRDTLGFVRRAAREIEQVLRNDHRNFGKDRITRRLNTFLGEGLLTSEGDFWRRQRRLSQPAFHRQRVNSYAETMVEYAGKTSARWRDG